MSSDDLGDLAEHLASIGGLGPVPAHVAGLCTEVELLAAWRGVMPKAAAGHLARSYFAAMERGVVGVLDDGTVERLAQLSPDSAKRVEEYRRTLARLSNRHR